MVRDWATFSGANWLICVGAAVGIKGLAGGLFVVVFELICGAASGPQATKTMNMSRNQESRDVMPLSLQC